MFYFFFFLKIATDVHAYQPNLMNIIYYIDFKIYISNKETPNFSEFRLFVWFLHCLFGFIKSPPNMLNLQ